MPHLLHLHSDTPLPTIQAAVGRVRPREIALIFPYGVPVALAGEADSAALHSLYRYCETLDKAVVIIGGDEALRAAAVLAGFAAATSLDAWKGASGSRFPHPMSAPDDEGEWPTPLTLVGNDPDQEVDLDVLPDYVQLLLGDEGYTGPRESDADLEERIARNTHPLEDDEDDIASIVSESYEDGITSTIRDTSGLADLRDVLGSSSDEDESSDSSTM